MTTPQSPSASAAPLSDKLYNQLKLSATLLLPALAAAYFGLAQIWGLPAGAEVSGTLSVINVFVGVLVRYASAVHNANVTAEAKVYDGEAVWEPLESGEGSTLRFTSVNHTSLMTKDSLTFRLIQPEPEPELADK